MLNVIIFGPPGVGKGTQSDLLIKKYNIKHLCTGDILREEKKNGTELGLTAKEYHEKGNLVPSDLINQMMEKAMVGGDNGYLFDGYPRRVDQAVFLDKKLESLDSFVTLVIALNADNDVLKERLLLRGQTSGRPDDQDPEIIDTRLSVYAEETVPVLEYYTMFGKVVNIDGTKSIVEVFKLICEAIDTQTRVIKYDEPGGN